MNRRHFIGALGVTAIGAGAGKGLVSAQDLSPLFRNTDGAIVLYDSNNSRYIRHNEARCRQRFSPYSTFKIPNALIGLETGVIRDADFRIVWDKRKYPPQPFGAFDQWKRDHTLRTAMKYSVVWYYRELARMVGARRMKEYVTKFGYGNMDTSGGVAGANLFDAFWLNSTLQISADEQIEFLKRFYAGRLPISKRSLEIVKEILVLEETPAYKLSGKTGGGSAGNGKALGWFVGYVETGRDVYFFATNIEGESFAAIRDKRIDLTKQILTTLGYLPAKR